MDLAPNAHGVTVAITAAQHVELLIASVQRDIFITMENASNQMVIEMVHKLGVISLIVF